VCVSGHRSRGWGVAMSCDVQSGLSIFNDLHEKPCVALMMRHTLLPSSAKCPIRHKCKPVWRGTSNNKSSTELFQGK